MKITINNYEEYALDYLEGNLSPDDQKQFLLFLDDHPEIKAIMENLEEIKLPVFSVGMPGKNKLYRDTGTVRSLGFYLRTIAAALLVLIIAAILWNNVSRDSRDLVITDHRSPSDQKSEAPVVPVVPSPPDEEATPKQGQTQVLSKPGRSIEKTLEVQKVDPAETIVSADLIETNENMEVISELPLTHDTRLVYEPVPVVFIDKIEIKPVIQIIYPIEKTDMVLPGLQVDDEKETLSKIGNLLAKANLIPTGLREEFSASSIREKIIPETYVDLK
jgi:hypothetical protein